MITNSTILITDNRTYLLQIIINSTVINTDNYQLNCTRPKKYVEHPVTGLKKIGWVGRFFFFFFERYFSYIVEFVYFNNFDPLYLARKAGKPSWLSQTVHKFYRLLNKAKMAVILDF